MQKLSKKYFKKVEKGGDVISLRQWKNASEEQKSKWIAENRPVSRGLGNYIYQQKQSVRRLPRITPRFKKLC